jgi:hypothetical protein
MSYVRRGPDSDVYVFQTMQEKYECDFCSLRNGRLLPGGHFETALPSAMIEHLLKHRAEGHAVPDRAIEALRRCVEDADAPLALLRELGACWGRLKHSRLDLVGRMPAKLRSLLDRADNYEQRRLGAAPEQDSNV